MFTTGRDSVKGRHLRRDLRIALVVDDRRPPVAFVLLRGRAALSEDPLELLGLRDADRRSLNGCRPGRRTRAAQRRPRELLVRVTVERMIAETDVAG